MRANKTSWAGTSHELFNNSLSKYIDGGTTYSDYNKHILEAGTNTTTIRNQKKRGWFHFSRNSLLPFIEERDALLLGGELIKPEIKKNAEINLFFLEPYDAVYT